MKARILFVDDDDTFRSVLEREIVDFGFEVTSQSSGEAALEWLEEHEADVALIDLRMPGMDGHALLKRLAKSDPALPVVLLTGHGSLPDAVEAMRNGAYDFLSKPVTLGELERTLLRALERRQLGRENERLRELFDRNSAGDILGESEAMVSLRSMIQKVARSGANVLVTGENGTGKELVARAIHAASPRGNLPFVVINCGAIPRDLIESELFGHGRGAFTGASAKKRGLIELAEGGTLFLDEIGELPLEVQPALLRAVQFGELRPVGSETTRTVDVRVLSATNRDLTQDIAERVFREDLYHRLSTLVIHVPSLRERGRDVALLAEVFLGRHNEQLGPADTKTFSPAALEKLESMSWSGNVRELENVVTRLATLVDANEIRPADVERFASTAPPADSTSLPALDLQVLERLAIEAAMERHGKNRKKVAAELGIAVKTLYNKIRLFGIDVDA